MATQVHTQVPTRHHQPARAFQPGATFSYKDAGMNALTLNSLRRLLFFTQAEAAELVGNVSERSWIHWEKGTRPVPVDVEKRMQELAAWYVHSIAEAENAIATARQAAGPHTEVVPPRLIWYSSLGDWLGLVGRDALLWRPHCGAVAHLAAKYNGIVVEFNADAYAAFLAESQHPDLEQTRMLWANSHRI